MGTVVWLKNIRIEVRSREKNHTGRPHCHAVGPGSDASIDLVTFEVLESSGYAKSDVKEIIEKIKEHHEILMEKWREYHG
jgi:Domain of unknown function (DUF4160)